MASPTQTQTDLSLHLEAGEEPRGPVLTIVHHPDAAFLGRRVALSPDAPLVLGRLADPFGTAALDDSLVSRRHVEIRRAEGRATAEDLGSHNGTFVNGAAIRAHELEPGDVLGVGRVLLLFHLGPASHTPPQHAVFAGMSHALAQVVDTIALVAKKPVAVLIQGETGVGKELVARELHRQSGRAGALVAVNCGALADGVLHSELFGHARGAFSGADRERPGLVAAAQGGTLFLDEIGDASPALQASLLRLLEQREYRSVGSERVLLSDARFIAATHVDLAAAVEAARFRRDLFGRLNRWVIRIPPLRERPEDAVPLAMGLAERLTGRKVRLARNLALALLRYRWPANVRELEAVIEQAVAEQDGQDTLQLTESLTARLDPKAPARPAPEARPEPPKPRAERPSRERIEERLASLDGNVKALARELGIGRTTLYRWMEDAGIDIGALREGR